MELDCIYARAWKCYGARARGAEYGAAARGTTAREIAGSWDTSHPRIESTPHAHYLIYTSHLLIQSPPHIYKSNRIHFPSTDDICNLNLYTTCVYTCIYCAYIYVNTLCIHVHTACACIWDMTYHLLITSATQIHESTLHRCDCTRDCKEPRHAWRSCNYNMRSCRCNMNAILTIGMHARRRRGTWLRSQLHVQQT